MLPIVFCCAALASAQVKSTVEEKIRAMPPNSPVELRLNDGAKLRGWVVECSAQNFVLNHEDHRQLQRSEYRFDSVRSVKPIKSVHPSHTGRNILIGVGIAVAVIGITIGAIAAHGFGMIGG
jgi:hypothetical protein